MSRDVSTGSRTVFRWLAAAVWAAACLACSGGDGDGDGPTGTGAPPRIEVTNAGTGDASTEPLWPMKVGARFRKGDEEQAVARTSDRFGKRWLLEQATGEAPFWAGDDGWNQGRPEAFWSVSDEGLVLRARGSQEALVTPILVVPATVRSGMRWRSLAGDGSVAAEGRVDGGDVRRTSWGDRRFWKVTIDLPDRTDRQASQWVQEFIEGRGPADATFAVVPLGETPKDVDFVPARVPMKPSGQDIPAMGVQTRSFSAVEDPATGSMEAHMGVLDPNPDGVENGPDTVYISGRRMAFFTDAQGATKPIAPPGSLPIFYKFGPCQDAAATSFDKDGERLRIPLTEEGTALHKWTNPPKWIPGTEKPGALPQYPDGLAGIVATANGSAQGFVAEDDSLRGTHPFLMTAWYPYVEYWEVEQGPASKTHGDAIVYGPWTRPHGIDDVQRVIALKPLSDDGSVDVVLRGNNLLAHARLATWWNSGVYSNDITGIARDAGTDGPWIDEVVAVLRPDNTRDIYQVSEDGLIWRLRLTDGVLARHFLGALDVPDGERVVGVVPLAGDSLQVWTEDGWSVSTWINAVPYFIASTRLHTYTVSLPEPTKGEPMPDFLGLSAIPTGRDVLLCLSAGRDLPDGAWMIGGETARTVRQSPNCLLIVRPWKDVDAVGVDGAVPPLVPPVGPAWVLHGSLPQIGEVEILAQPGPPEPIPDDIVASPAGGFEGYDLKAGPGLGVIERTRAVAIGGSGPILDPRTGGLWTALVKSPANGACGEEPVCTILRHFAHDPAQTREYTLPKIGSDREYFDKLMYHQGRPAIEYRDVIHVLDYDEGPVPVKPPHEDGIDDRWDCQVKPKKAPPIEELMADCGDGKGATIRLDPEAGSGIDLAPLRMTFYRGGHRPWLWRIDWSTFAMDAAPVPDAARFVRGIDLPDGSCDANGACFVLVREPGSDLEPSAWSVLRMDRKGIGVHEFARGRAEAGSTLGRVRVDDDVVVLLDATSVVWRGLRDEEPATCDGCDAREACLRGFCDCAYGNVRLDGTCLDDVMPGTFASCAEATTASIGPGTLVRLDADGEGPMPDVVAACDDPEGWADLPTFTDPLTDWASFMVIIGGFNCYPAAPDRFPWKWRTSTVAAPLSGRFEVRFHFEEPPDEQWFFDSVLSLSTIDHFDPVTGLFQNRCAGTARPFPDSEVAIGLMSPGLIGVTSKNHDVVATGSPALRLTRDSQGLMRLFDGKTVVWTSSKPMPGDYRIVLHEWTHIVIDSIRVLY